MISFTNLSLVLLAYMMGSIPSAVWIGKLLYGVDVRDYGSGNAGATNTFRVLGKRAGLPVLILDILKGFVAVKLVWLTAKYLPDTQQFVNLELSLGLAALIGHIFPVFAGFRGGKGVATMLGILVAIHPEAAFVCALAFITTLFFTGYVSLSSMVSGVTFPIVIMVFYSTNSSINIFSLAVAILILVTHQRNIERIINREESRVKWYKKRF